MIIGTGSPAGCTSAAVVRAVARGGVITFNCGPNPVVIKMTGTAKLRNTSWLTIKSSTLHDNPSAVFWTRPYPGIFFHSSGHPRIVNSKLS